MITMEDWVTIKNLKAKNPKMGTRTIAKLLGISRNTVKRALKQEQPVRYERKPSINAHLKPFVDLIDQLYWQKKLSGSRILEELRSKGFKGSQSAFYRYLAKIKSKQSKFYQSYETAPGEQSQFDWSPYTVTIDQLLTRVYVFSYINGFSRYTVFEASLSVHQSSVFEALENGFYESGGVPERVQTDNASCFVKNASKTHFEWNSHYLAFCGHFGFRPTRSLPGHPWSKGKVEKTFSYLENHFIAANQFESFEDFYNRLKQFQDVFNKRIHQTTKHVPLKSLEKEKPLFIPLPKQRYVGIKQEVRKATSDCLISFNGNRYSVPWMFATRLVWIKVSHGYYLEIYSQENRCIARHKLVTGKGQVIINSEHFKGNKNTHGNWKRLALMFNQRYPGYQQFLDKLQAQKRINARYHLGRILDISAYYSPEQVVQTIEAALEYNVFNFFFFQGYLENHFKQDIQVSGNPDLLKQFKQKTSVVRNLKEYALKEGGSHEC